MLIDCETCAVRDIACDDCVVGVLLSSPGSSATLDDAERVAIDVLARSGLVPPLRLVRAAGTPGDVGNETKRRAKGQLESSSYDPAYRPIEDTATA